MQVSNRSHGREALETHLRKLAEKGKSNSAVDTGIVGPDGECEEENIAHLKYYLEYRFDCVRQRSTLWLISLDIKVRGGIT